MNFRSFNNSKKSEKNFLYSQSCCNPLNNFLFEKLAKLRSAADVRGLKNQSFCYAKILKSLSKYPLPLLSVSQAIELEGVGDKTAMLILKILKSHYQNYILTSKNLDSNDFNANSTPIGAIDNNNAGEIYSNSQTFEQKDINFYDFDLNVDFEAQQIDNTYCGETQVFSQKDQNIISYKKEKSTISKNKRPISKEETVFDKDLYYGSKRLLIENEPFKTKSKYKGPDPESVPASILMSLLAFQTENNAKYASKKEIKKISETLAIKCQEINNWNCLKTLMKHEILYMFEFDSVEKYCLSQEGEKMANKLFDFHLQMLDKKQEEAKKSEHSITENDLETFSFKEKDKSKLDPLSPKPLYPIIERNSSQEKTEHKNEENEEKPLINNENSEIKIPLEMIESLNVVLIVDNREVKNQEDRNYIYEHLVSNGLDCELGTLPLGDFLWIARLKERNNEEIKLFLLDFIVERKTCDDLASSILDGRYNSQRSRLKECQIKNTYWLIEGKPTHNAHLPPNVLETATFNLQFIYQFKVHKTENITETLKWLTHMTLSLQRKIKTIMKTKKELSFSLTLEQFLSKNEKTLKNVGNIFQRMLTNVKALGKQACLSIYQNYKTPKLFYRALMNLSNNQERIELLSQVARKANKKLVKYIEEKEGTINLKITLAKRLVILFCYESYPEIYEEEANEIDI